jgi:hypothetical protein
MTQQRYSWHDAYSAAISVTNSAVLKERIYEALAACEQRRLSPMDTDEAKALAEAEQVLQILQNERADFDTE